MQYNDSDWAQVDLPHDWAIWGTVDQKNNLAQGFRAAASAGIERTSSSIRTIAAGTWSFNSTAWPPFARSG